MTTPRADALQQSEQRYRSFVELTSQWAWVTDAAGQVVEDLPKLRAFTGQTQKQLLGAGWADALHPADRQRTAQVWQHALTTQTPYQTEYRMRRHDGVYRVMLAQGVPILDGEEQVIEWVGTCTDITDRKAAEDKLRESEARYRILYESLRDAFVRVDMDGRLIEFNPLYCQMLGYNAKELRALTYQDLTPARWHPLEARIVRKQILPRGYSDVYEKEYRRKDGTTFPVELRTILARDDSGQPSSMWALVRDISERKQAAAVQQFLAQSVRPLLTASFFDELVQFLGTLLEAPAVGVLRLLEDGRQARTLAHWCDARLLPSSDEVFALEGTPSAALIGPEPKTVPRHRGALCRCLLGATVPEDRRAEQYVGVTLYNHHGQAIGLIVVLGAADLHTESQTRRMLGQIAARAAGELEHLNAEEDLRESEERLRLLSDNLPNSAVYQMVRAADGSTRFTYVSAGFERLNAIPSAAVLRDASLLQRQVVPEFVPVLLECEARSARELSDFDLELPLQRPDGELRWMRLRSRPRRLADGSTLWDGVQIDISDRKAAEQALRASKERYQALFEHISNGVAIYETCDDGQDFILRDFNAAAERIDGQPRDELIGRRITDFRPNVEAFGLLEVLQRVVRTGTAEQLAARLYQDARRTGWYENFVYRLPTGELVTVVSDVTPLKEHEQQLEHLAYNDALTDLPNRVLLADRLQQAMAQSERRGQQLAVIYLDLDGFKAINDSDGHDVGDQLLITLAGRMHGVLRHGDTLARLGGDEFAAVLVDLDHSEDCLALLDRLLAVASEPVRIAAIDHCITISLGVTLYPQGDPVDADQLLRQADQAMYQAKLAGKNCYRLFDAEQDRQARHLEERLRRKRDALAHGEFVLHYQPIVNMRSGQLLGLEALIRWQHPDRGLLPPQEFLPLIENHRLAINLGEWVMESALAQLETWWAEGIRCPVSINLCARQLQQSDFLPRLAAIMAAHPRVEPARLSLEVLETTALEDLAHASTALSDCRELGISIALDDFGTGYSSLAYLRRLPVAKLKIDRGFVSDMLEDPDDLAIIDSVLGLSAAFRLQAIAEGVETAEQGELLLQFGCELAQGYAIARPMPASAVADWRSAWRPDPLWAECKTVRLSQRALLYATVEHRALSVALSLYRRGDRDLPPNLDIAQCRFNERLGALERTDLVTEDQLRQLEQRHRDWHRAAEAAVRETTPDRHGAPAASDQDAGALSTELLAQLRQLVH